MKRNRSSTPRTPSQCVRPRLGEMLAPSLDSVRIFLHILAAGIWVGGQIVLAGVVPGLRKIGPEATQAAAKGFARVAWPAFVLAFVTGVWNLIEADQTVGTGYQVTLGIKILLVVAAGGAAAAHAASDKKVVIAATGAIGLVASLVVMFLGAQLSSAV